MEHDLTEHAIVYCQGAFNTTNGKTAHGLVRRSERFSIRAVIDARYDGRDAGQVLDGYDVGIPVVPTLAAGLELGTSAGETVSHFIIGLAPDGGRLPPEAREVVETALKRGLHVISGLHDFLSDDPELLALAQQAKVTITDVRRPPERALLHFFSGIIEEVDCLTVALLGTDSAVGKRTTAWLLVDGLRKAGLKCELVGTGQTAWLQGARYSIVLDSLVNDFIAGEIEHATWSAWKEQRPDVIILEGQGSLLNPAYPGGFELVAAGRPDAVIMQHAPGRKEYDGFPGYPVHPLPRQIQAVEMVSGRSVIAVTLNHENIPMDDTDTIASTCEELTGLPCVAPLRQGTDRLVDVVTGLLAQHRRKN